MARKNIENDDYSTVNPVVKRMLENFKLSENAEADNRKRALKALKFRRGGKDQWDDNLYDLRISNNRPAESYNQIPQFIHRITNNMRMNMPQTKFIPNSEGSKEIAEIFEDLARTIQASSEGEVAYDAAADSQVTIGWGYWRYITDYENETSFDQIIKLRWVPNVFKIYDDPYSLLQDHSDRTFLIEIEDIKLEDFNAEYKSKENTCGSFNGKYDTSQLQSIGDSSPQWATDTTVRVAEYWEVTNKFSKLYRLMDGTITKNKPKDTVEYLERDVKVPKVMWYKCTGCEILEEREWQGIYIPYVRIDGETLFIDGAIYYSGLVEGLEPAQKQYNYWSNAATEAVALMPKAPYIGAVGQFKGLEKFWDNANVKNYPYLPYNPIDVNGITLSAPQRTQAGADISSMIGLVQQAQQNFYTTSGIYPAALGQQSNEISGRAINARKVEGDLSNFHFSDNLARGMRFGGRIMKDLFPKIYDGARIISLLKEDKSHREVRVNQELEDEQNEDGTAKILDLTVGTYDVMITTGPSFTTKRQEAAESQIQMLQTPLGQIMAQSSPDIIIRNQDWPGADEIADRMKALLPPAIQNLDNDKMKNIPPELQAQMQQMGQVIQQLQGVVQKQGEELQSKQADIQLKEAEIAAKASEMHNKGESEARKSEIDILKLQLESRKLDFEEQKLQIESELAQSKLVLDTQKMRIDAKTSSGATASDIAGDPDFHEGEPPIMVMMGQMAQVLNEGLQQVANITAQSSAAIVESNAMVAQTNQQVAQAISAPKVLVRNQQTGQVEGITPATIN